MSNPIIRRFDDLGRIVIPKMFRIELFGSSEKSEGKPMEMYIKGNKIILEPHEESEDFNSIFKKMIER